MRKKQKLLPRISDALLLIILIKIVGALGQTTCNNGLGRVLYERLPNQQLQGFDDDVVRDTAPPFRVLEKCQDLCLRDRTASNNLARACSSFDFQPGGRISSFSGTPDEYDESSCYLTREQPAPEGIGILMLVPNSVHFTEVCLTSSRPERECPSRRYVFERHPRKKLKLPVSDIKEITAANRSDCEDKCLNEFSFVCRSANFDSNLRSCSLSRFTRRTHPELMEDDPNSDYLENTCLNAERRCDGLAVYVKEENKRLGGPFEVDKFINMTLEECQTMCLRAEKYFCRSVEFDDQTKECILSEEDSISQKDDIGISSSPSHHFYDLVCLDNQRGTEYPDNSVTSHLFSSGRRPDTAFQRYRNSRLGGEFHSEITGRSLSECLDECLRQTSFQCRSAVYSDRFRTCRLSRYNQRDGMRIIYDADYDYYENLMHNIVGGEGGDDRDRDRDHDRDRDRPSTRPDYMGTGINYRPPYSGDNNDRDKNKDRYPTTPTDDRDPTSNRYPSAMGPIKPDYGSGYPERFPFGAGERYPSSGEGNGIGSGTGGGGGGNNGGNGGGRYPYDDRYPTIPDNRYPDDLRPGGGNNNRYPGEERYPEDLRPPGRYPDDLRPDNRYPDDLRPGNRYPGNDYRPIGGNRYPDDGYLNDNDRGRYPSRYPDRNGGGSGGGGYPNRYPDDRDYYYPGGGSSGGGGRIPIDPNNRYPDSVGNDIGLPSRPIRPPSVDRFKPDYDDRYPAPPLPDRRIPPRNGNGGNGGVGIGDSPTGRYPNEERYPYDRVPSNRMPPIDTRYPIDQRYPNNRYPSIDTRPSGGSRYPSDNNRYPTENSRYTPPITDNRYPIDMRPGYLDNRYPETRYPGPVSSGGGGGGRGDRYPPVSDNRFPVGNDRNPTYIYKYNNRDRLPALGGSSGYDRIPMSPYDRDRGYIDRYGGGVGGSGLPGDGGYGSDSANGYDRGGSYDRGGNYDRGGSYDRGGNYDRGGSYDRGTYDRGGGYGGRPPLPPHSMVNGGGYPYEQPYRPGIVGGGGGGGNGGGIPTGYDNSINSHNGGDGFGGFGPIRPIGSSRCSEDGGESFKQMGVRQKVRRQYVRRVLPVPSLVHCQRECIDAKDFICRSFNYRESAVSYDPEGNSGGNGGGGNDRGGSTIGTTTSVSSREREVANCELSDRDTRELDLHNPQMFDTGNYDYYERSYGGRTNGGDPDCLDVSQTCNEDGMEFTLRTPEGFVGRIYTYGFYDRCFFRGNGASVNVLRISGAQGYPECGTQRYGDTMTNIVVVQFSDNVQTGRDKRYNLTCIFRGPGEAVVTSGYIGAGSGSPIPIEYLPAENTLSSKVRLMILYQNRPTTTIAVGDPLTFRLEPQDGYNQLTDIFATNVIARDPYSGRSIQLIDRYGCPVDPYVFPELDKLRTDDSLEARFNAFKIPESNFLVFEATVRSCREGCQPAYCPSQSSGRSEPSFGRRKRSVNDTEELTISENDDETTITSIINSTTLTSAEQSVKLNDTEKLILSEDEKQTTNNDYPEHVREMIEVFESRDEIETEAIPRKLMAPIETVCLTPSEYHGLISAVILLMILLLSITLMAGLAYRRYWGTMLKNRSVDRGSINSFIPSTLHQNMNISTNQFNAGGSSRGGGSTSGGGGGGQTNNSSRNSLNLFNGNLQKTFATGNLSRMCQIPVMNPIRNNNGNSSEFDDPSEPIYTDPSLFERSRSLRSISFGEIKDNGTVQTTTTTTADFY